MFYEVRMVSEEGAERSAAPAAGRFVVHRHRDAGGAHLDLRLEQDGYLMGWRIASTALEGAPWATEKTPHPVDWLERDGTAEREDAGAYAWLRREDGLCEVELRGTAGVRVLRVARTEGLPVTAVRAVAAALSAEGLDASDAAGLIADGALARRRAVERFCGLSRELDGDAFDGAAWRTTLAGMPLARIHEHLRGVELRFDAKYPPVPVSQPEALEVSDEAAGKALEIVTG